MKKVNYIPNKHILEIIACVNCKTIIFQKNVNKKYINCPYFDVQYMTMYLLSIVGNVCPYDRMMFDFWSRFT